MMCSAGRQKGLAVRENERMDAKTRRTLGRWPWQGSGSGRAGKQAVAVADHSLLTSLSTTEASSTAPRAFARSIQALLRQFSFLQHLHTLTTAKTDGRRARQPAVSNKCATTLANGTQPSSSGGRSIGGKPTQASTRRFPPFTPALHHTSSKQTPPQHTTSTTSSFHHHPRRSTRRTPVTLAGLPCGPH